MNANGAWAGPWLQPGRHGRRSSPPLCATSSASCAFVLAYIVAYHFGMSFSPAVSAPFWFPDSVLLCALLCTRTTWWWLLLLAVLPIRLLSTCRRTHRRGSWCACYINDCAKAAGCALLLRRFMADPIRLTRCAISASSACSRWRSCRCSVPSVVRPRAAVLGHPFWPSFEQWLLGDVDGQPHRHADSFLLDAAAAESGHVQHDAGHRSWRARHRIARHVVAGVRSRMRPSEFGRNAFLRAGAFHGVGGHPLSHVRRDRGGCAAVVFAVDCRHRWHRVIRRTSRPRKHRAGCSISCCCAPRRCTWRRCSSSSGRSVSDSLRESEERFRIIADQAPMMMWTSGYGRRAANLPTVAGWTSPARRSNRTWARAGRSPCIRTTYRRRCDFYLPIFRRAYPSRWSTAHGVTMASIAGFTCAECRAYGANGEFTGYIGSAIDITERRQQEAALKRSEARYRDVVESQIGCVCRFLPDATLTFVNSAYCRFLGKPRLELLGASFLELLPPVARPAAREAIGARRVELPTTRRGSAKWSTPTVLAAGRAGCVT